MEYRAAGIAQLQTKLVKHRLDALLVSKPANVRYLTGFSSPKDGRALLLENQVLLFTDGRYALQAREEVERSLVIWKGSNRWNFVRQRLRQRRVRNLGVESDSISFNEWHRLRKILGCKIRPVTGWIDELRTIKHPWELNHIRRAAEVNDRAFHYILPFIRPGIQEMDIALELEWFLRKHAAFQVAFELIVASGPNGAKPHARPSSRLLEKGDLVTLDYGCVCNGYNSDITRTVALGKPSSGLKSVYHAVLRAQQAALTLFQPGMKAKKADAAARKRLRELGYGPYFTHSLGHGVGLEIHEAPRISADSDARLKPGMVITCEPGVYIPEQGGVRIEDLVLITENGHEKLSSAPTEMICL